MGDKEIIQSSKVDLTCPLWCQEVKVLDVLSEGLDVLMDGVWCDAPNLDEAVVLDEDGVAGKIAVDDRFLADTHH